MRPFRIALTAAIVLLACLAAGEAGRRMLDGYRLSRLRLVKNPSSLNLTWSEPANRSDQSLLEAIPADAEANRAWFAERPPDREPRSTPAWVDQRRAIGNAEANYVWNAAALNEPTVLAYLRDNQSKLDDVFTFRPPNGQPHPRYRFYPDIQTGFGVANHFGWKSREITQARSSDVIRIAMLGDSTTNNYPGLVEHWLNLWARQSQLGIRFEIINAARPGADALDAAAIFDVELAPFDPDYVVVYGFGNAFSTADTLIPLPPRLVKSAPQTAPMPMGTVDRVSKRVSATLDPLVPWSAAADFLRHRIAGERGDSLAPEPSKPATTITFPPDIDEDAPNPERIASRRGGRLMGLDLYLQALGKITAVAKERRARVFVSTFRVLAFDGLLLPKGGGQDGILYDTLNTYWWPYTYAEIHRLTQFFNRTLHVWADASGTGVIPIDEQMPWRRELYGDGIHERPVGEALHAWIVLQQLMPAIREDLRQHRLPRQQHVIAAPNADAYWKIERVKIADAIATAEAMNAAILPPPADEIPGAFVLSKIVAADPGAQVVQGAVPTITTSTQPSGYAASVPIEPAAAAKLSGRGWIGVRLKVTQGRLSVGVLNKSAQKFLAYTGVPQSPDIQNIQIDVEDLADVGGLMISNDRGETRASSSGELHGIVLKKLRE